MSGETTAELLDVFLVKKYGSVEKSPIEVIEALGNTEAYEFAEFVASCLLQEKEQSYKDEREAQREFYLPANPTAEDISQARAIIAQQKSQLFEKEQRIKELEEELTTRTPLLDRT